MKNKILQKRSADLINGKPKLPSYKPINGYNQLIYTNQCASIKSGKIILSKGLSINIPQWNKYYLNYYSLLKYNVKNMKMYNILKDKYIK